MNKKRNLLQLFSVSLPLSLLLVVACGDDTTPQITDSGSADGRADVSEDGDVPGSDAVVPLPDLPCPSRCIFYVDKSVSSGGDGKDPASAFAHVQSGLDAAYYAGGGRCDCEVRVAAGIYYVYQRSTADTIRLRPGVKLLGGFASGSSGPPSPIKNRTLLIGWKEGTKSPIPAWCATESDCPTKAECQNNICVAPPPAMDAGADGTVDDGGVSDMSAPDLARRDMGSDAELGVTPDAGPISPERVYHVVTGAEGAVIDGFVIAGGRAIDDNLFANPNNFGGGIYNAGASITMRNLIFEYNEAVYGGAVHNGRNSATIERCRFFYNTALLSGGAVENRLSSPRIKDSSFEHNKAPKGGAIFNRAYAKAALTGCKFVENSAQWGGAVANEKEAATTFTFCFFTNNTATFFGGAVSSDASTPSFETCTFSENSAPQGGAIYAKGGLGTVKACRFERNSGDTGGAIYLTSGSTPAISEGLFIENTATLRGGAVASNGQSAPVFDRSTFARNSATTGGALYYEQAAGQLVSSVIRDNMAQDKGGGIATTESSPKIINCTLVDNKAPWGQALANEGGGAPEVTNSIVWSEGLRRQALIANDDTSLAKVTFSCLDGGCEKGLRCTSDETGNVKPYVSPFVNKVELRLRPGSICAEAGDGDAIKDFPKDRAGEPRVVNDDSEGDAVVDMGAYECQTDCTCDPTTDRCCETDGKTCRFGCDDAGKCFAECNPTLNGCCASDGTLPQGVWGDETTGYCWQHPIKNTGKQYALPHFPEKGDNSHAYTYCRDLTLAGFRWQVPSINALRSLTRYRPSVYYNPITKQSGACAIKQGCSGSCSSAACNYSDDYPAGHYWPDALGSVSRDSGLHLYSTFWANASYGCTYDAQNNPSWCQNWGVNFRYGVIKNYGWGGSAAHNKDLNIRCMRK